VATLVVANHVKSYNINEGTLVITPCCRYVLDSFKVIFHRLVLSHKSLHISENNILRNSSSHSQSPHGEVYMNQHV
jgi:hypothetical protein